MNPHSDFAAPDELLAHASFVRSLAQSLVGDSEEAEDAAQETLLVALENPPKSPGSVQGWFATVLRNAIRKARRGEKRRLRRELETAKPELTLSTEQLVEREILLRKVVDAVLSLEEPYRSSILLRFYEGLPPREIALRLNAPVETVRSRIQRGLEKLRGRLDGEYGGNREAWCLGLISLVGWKSSAKAAAAAGGTTALSTGVIAMSLQVKVLVCVLVLGGGFTLWSISSEKKEIPHVAELSPGSTKPLAQAAKEPAEASKARTELSAISETNLPEEKQILDRKETESLADPLHQSVLSGKVLVDGFSPREALELRLNTPGASPREAVTGDSGTFQFEELSDKWNGSVTIPEGYMLQEVSAGNIRISTWNQEKRSVELATPMTGLLLQLHRFPQIRGRVVDASGSGPVPYAKIQGQLRFERKKPEFSMTVMNLIREADENGIFKISLPADAVQQLSLCVLSSRDTGLKKLDLDPMRLTSDLDLGDVSLSPTLDRFFFVRDTEGKPISGAVALAGPNGEYGRSEPTNSVGVGILHISASQSQSVRVGALGYRIRSIPIPTQESSELIKVTLERGNRLSILVEDASGKTPPYLTLRCVAKERLFSNQFEAPAAPEGIFEGADFEMISYADPVYVAAGGAAVITSEISDGKVSFELECERKSAGILLSGLEPGSSFQIQVRDRVGTVLTEENFEGLGLSQWKTATLRVSGKLRDLEGNMKDSQGLPLTKVKVRVSGNSEKDYWHELESDSDGHFELPHLYAETVVLEFEKQGYRPLKLEKFEIPIVSTNPDFVLTPLP